MILFFSRLFIITECEKDLAKIMFFFETTASNSPFHSYSLFFILSKFLPSSYA